MWCFLGKAARRKSLKPDGFRKAVTKQKSIGNASFDAPLPVPGPAKKSSDLERSQPRSPPEFAVVIPSPATGEKEVEEDDLRAKEGPDLEDLKEALGTRASPIAERGDTEIGVRQESAPAEDVTKELATHAPEVDEELVSKATSEEIAPLAEPEGVETSQELPIDGEEITICLPSEAGTPLTTPKKSIFVFGSTVSHEIEGSPGPSSNRQETPVAEYATDSSVQSTLRTPQSNNSRAGLRKPPKITGIVSRSAEPQSPVQDAIKKLEIASLELVNGDALRSEDVDGLVLHHEAKADDSGKREGIELPHEGLHSFDVEQQEVAAQSMEAFDVTTSPYPEGITHGNIEAGKCAEDEELVQGALTVLPTALFPTEASEPNASELRDESNQVQSPSSKSKSESERAGSYEDCGREDPMARELIRPIEGDAAGTSASCSEENQDDELSEHAANAPEPMANSEAIAAMPVKTTRSGARFSDDTNLLKDFLNRVQAKKKIGDIKKPASEPPTTSPRRSPRKALTELTSNSPSPQKPKDLANRPGTPPGKQRLDAFSFDDVDELTAEPTSCRRSTRTRLPAPAKAPPGAPSFIPVRRADGTDAVVLQKSMAQELAVQTRANTRRNKGQSKPPSVALQNLTAETVETSSTRMHAHENVKSVGWDERLVYYSYHDLPNAAEEEGKEEKRPKGRRLRGLGAANGTPAPKRVADVTNPKGTPAPRRRGKLR